ncbi:hypothetical protein QF027_008061 [Streptomyces canus]|nr:hypothetical protein [Streptomyces canus]MDQ0765426.1 hypothetical protein [Streptomyces canus]
MHPLAIGKKVQVRTDTDEVIVTLAPGGAEVARHPRCWAKQQTITDPVHARAAAILRGDYRHRQASQALSRRQNTAAAADLVEVEQRQLDSYDRMFTLIEGGGQDDEPEESPDAHHDQDRRSGGDPHRPPDHR